ncbi:hypothetical protein AWENTII_012895 [Aspergillus wentii]
MAKRESSQGEASRSKSKRQKTDTEESTGSAPNKQGKKQKKGASATAKRPTIEEPGRPQDPATFLTIENNEQKVAGYVGYSDVADLRRLAMSWPLLKAYPRFSKISVGLARKTAFRLIHESENDYLDVDADQKWPVEENSPTSVRSRHLACLLLDLETDLKKYRFEPEENSEKNKNFFKNFKCDDLELPSEVDPKAPPPDLGPHPREHRLEAINRCFCLLKYMKGTCQLKSWNTRFVHGLETRISVDQSYVPRWMREAEPATIAIDPLAQVTAADKLTPIEVTLRWRNRDKLENILDQAVENNIDLPSQNLKFTQDPRLFTSIFSFKDAIRRAYNCQELGIDIKDLRLRYNSAEGEVEKNILTESWEEAIEVFNSKEVEKYFADVAFEEVDDPETSIFESPDPPPEVRTFFELEDSEVKLNNSDISNRTIGLKEYLEDGGISPMDEIGTAPKPKKFATKAELLNYYGGYDVETEEGRRQWQRKLLANQSCNARAARLKLEKLPKGLTGAQKESITVAQELMHQKAIEEEHFSVTHKEVSDPEYYLHQQAFSGTDNRSGPPLDVCMRLLIAKEGKNGKYKSELLENFVNCSFYHYQVSGAIGLVLKLYGKIDAETLLKKTGSMKHAQADDVRKAAAELQDLCIHGALLADETGFGKTKQALLGALLHTILYVESDEQGKRCHKPMLLVVPPTLISQWLAEIRLNWPCFTPLLSYEDAAFRTGMELSTLPHVAMRELPDLQSMPTRLRYVFDVQNKAARRVIIITSYTTHKNRTGRVVEECTPGKPHTPRRFDPETKERSFQGAS